METLSETLYIIGGILFAVFAIGFCIFSHELGHFLAARLCGLHVDAFALGFRPFWRRKIGGVEYRLGYLPFGGYCDIPQIDCTDATPKSADGTELPRAKPLDRVITAFAGPFFNILSGLLVACLVWWIGIPQDSPKVRSFTVLEVEPGSPEARAGLRAGDRIVRLNGKTFFCTWSEFVKELLFTVGDVKLEVERGSAAGGRSVAEIRYQPKINPNAPSRLRVEGVAWPFFKVVIPIELTPERGSPAERAGILPGDILVAVGGEPVADYQDFQFALNLAGCKPVKVGLLRDGKPVEVTVTPEAVPGAEGSDFEHFMTGVLLSPRRGGESGFEIVHVYPGLPAAAAGLRPGDVPTAIDGIACADMQSFIGRIRELREKPFRITFRRGGETLSAELHAQCIRPVTIGVSLELRDHPDPFQQFAATLSVSWKSLRNIAVAVANKLRLTEARSTLSPRHMSGPLGMGMVLFSMVRHSSLMSGIYFTVMISFALAIFNLLPLPVLDGGHIFFGLIEIAIRRPLSATLVQALSKVFVVLLIGLMIYVTFFDARRIYYSIFTPPPAAPEVPEGGAAHGSAPTQP